MNQTRDTREQPDPLIEEVRGIRRAIEERCGGDWERLGEYLRMVGDEYLKGRRGEGSPDEKG